MTRLVDLIEERKQQAMDREIFQKAELVLKYLGRSIYSGDSNRREYVTEGLRFSNFGGAGNKEINISNNRHYQIVFTATDTDKIEIYVPGIWEEELDSIIERKLGFKTKTKGEE